MPAADYGLYTDTNGTHSIQYGAGNWEPVSFNNIVHQDISTISQSRLGEYTLLEGGLYMFGSSIFATGSNPTNNCNYLIRSAVDGIDPFLGESGGFMRNPVPNNHMFLNFNGIYSASANEDLAIEVQRFSTTAYPTVLQPGRSNLWILKLGAWPYIHLRKANADNQTHTQSVNYDTINWSEQEYVDTTYFSHSLASGDQAKIHLVDSGHYIVSYNLKLSAAVNSTQRHQSSVTRTTLNGVPQPSSYNYSYYFALNNGSVSGQSTMILIHATGSDTVLEVEHSHGRQDTNNRDISSQAGSTAITIVKLPEETGYTRISELIGSQSADPATSASIFYDTEDEFDTSIFSRPTDDVIQVNQAGDYIFMHGAYGRSTLESEASESQVHYQWKVNGLVTPYGGGSGYYNRGNTSNGDVYNFGVASSVFLRGLSSGDQVSLSIESLGERNEFLELSGSRYGISAISMNQLFGLSTITRRKFFIM